MSDELLWEDPSPDGRHRRAGRDWPEVAGQLRAAPGKWARVWTVSGTAQAGSWLTNKIKNGILPAFRPAGSYEAATRTVDGECRVYARYIGETAG